MNPIDKKIRAITIRFFAIQGAVFFVSIAFFFSFNFIVKQRLAESVFSAASYSLRIGDLRQAIVFLDESAEKYDFDVVYRSGSNEHLFVAPQSLRFDEYSKVTAGISFPYYAFVFKISSQSISNQGMVFFRFSLFKGIEWILLVLLIAFFSLFPFYQRAKRDISQRQKREIEIEKMSAIARTTQALAHDVRRPFSMLKMVLGAVSDADDPKEAKQIAKSSLPEVNQAMASVEGMIQDVMQIGSDSKPNQEVASPEAVIDAAINELFRVFPEADVGIEYDLNHEHCLFIDTMRVGRVLSNILVNAVQAMGANGSLWIKTKEDGEFIEFRIGNIGSWIPGESLPKLFEAFFTSGKKGGTGLGLAIAQKVVNEHGGRIRCESDKTDKYPQGYVEFIFTLPVSSEIDPKRVEPLPNHSSVIQEQLLKLRKNDSSFASIDELEQEKVLSKRLETISGRLPAILIVDDEAVYRNSLAGLLVNFRGGASDVAKIPVLFARNGREAMQIVENQNPFLVIQDIDLGAASKNGIDVIKDLRKSGFKGRICVHSNRFLFDDQKAATDAGADSVLPKPMSRSHLFKLILSSLPEFEVKLGNQPSLTTEKRMPKIAYIDDSLSFTLSWKLKLKDKIDIETFTSTSAFFARCEIDGNFLHSFDVIVTDFYFGPSDPVNGESFAKELRARGFCKPIYLASNGDFQLEDLNPALTGAIGKEIPTVEAILSWIAPSGLKPRE